MGQISRRAFFRTSTSCILATGLGCQGQSVGTGPFAGRELRMFVYAGNHEQALREVFVPKFESETGASVSLTPGWWDGIPKLKTAPESDPPFDLMITDATQGYPAAREGLFQKIRFANIPNHEAMTAKALEPWVYRHGYGLPYPDSVMTLAYHRRDGAAPPQAWQDLLHPEYSGKLGFYNSFYMSLYTFAAILADSNQQPGTAHQLIEHQLDEVFRFAKEQRQRIRLWWPTSTDMILALHEESVFAGNMHSPEYLQAMREKPDLGGAVPNKDRAMVQVFWAIPAGSQNVDMAEVALNLLFSHEVQLEFARRGMATARSDTAMTMAKEDSLWASLYPHTEAQFQNLQYYPYDVYASQWDQLADRWDRTILRGE